MHYVKRYYRWTLRDQTEAASSDDIIPDELSTNPEAAWKKREATTKVDKVEPLDPKTPISDDIIRFVCISDTHSVMENKGIDPNTVVPYGDVLLHAGDFSNHGSYEEIMEYNSHFVPRGKGLLRRWNMIPDNVDILITHGPPLGRLPHPVKIMIGGNHDLKLDWVTGSLESADVHRKLLSNFIYLQDAMVDVCGVNIYGSPWVALNGNWAFTVPRGKGLLRRWNMIPDNVDILITHGPPLGYGDISFFGYHNGCVDLLNTVQNRVKPEYHISGHIHEGYGMRTDGVTTYINAAMKYRSRLNPPIVFDMPIPPGHTKKELQEVMSSERLRIREILMSSEGQGDGENKETSVEGDNGDSNGNACTVS